VLYRETHMLLDDLAEAIAEGSRKEFMDYTAKCIDLGVAHDIEPLTFAVRSALQLRSSL
jgi:hypothetical protein